MPFELKLAWRYFRLRRKSLVRFTTLVAIIGIAAGVAGLIVAQAIANGFSEEMRAKVLQNTSHITVFDESNTSLSNPRIIIQQIEKIEDVKKAEATTYESAVISSDKESAYAVLRVQSSEFGVRSSKKTTTDHRPLTTDKPPTATISVGKELAEKLELKKGDEAEIITLQDEETPQNGAVIVGEVFETGLYEYDATWVFVDEANYLKIRNLQKFSPKVFSISVLDIYQADKTAGKIRRSLGRGFKVLDWQEANKPLFAALSLERKFALSIILLIIFIASLNITTTLSLLINERKPDIAILRTCGATTKNLVSIFLFEGIILSLTGIGLGVVTGLTMCLAGNYFRIISLSKKVYSLDYIPLRFDFESILLIAGLTFLLCLLAITYPVLRVSKIKPLEILRR